MRPARSHALATAGTGDVLTGVVAAFLAKGLEPRLAAAAASTAHGLAARALPQGGPGHGPCYLCAAARLLAVAGSPFRRRAAPEERPMLPGKK